MDLNIWKVRMALNPTFACRLAFPNNSKIPAFHGKDARFRVEQKDKEFVYH